MNSTPANNSEKSVIVEFPGAESVQAQAARWLAVLDADHVTETQRDAFRRWVNEDDSHRKEFESLVGFWDELNVLTQVTPPLRHGARPTTSRPGLLGWRQSLAAAAFTLLVVVTFVLWPRSPEVISYTTAVGEQKTIQLPDRSTVVLNTNSRIVLLYDENRRGVRLERGEALFDVAKNPERPFEVYAGERTVRAVGTAFSVRLKPEDVEVLVTEGVVEIDKRQRAPLPSPAVDQPPAMPNGAEPEGKVRVPAGRQAIISQNEAHEVLVAEIRKIEDRLSWRSGLLTFDREPLEQVVSEVSRYTATRFIIPEKPVREMIVGGVFRVGDMESLLEALELGFGVQAREVADNVIYLSMAEDSE